jgi:adenosylcobinamide amidohydrolase
VAVRRRGRWLVAEFPEPYRTAGWTILGGGFGRAPGVAWLEVRNADLGPSVDPEALGRDALAAEGLPEQPLFLTSCTLEAWMESVASAGDVAAHCIATVGLTNRRRIGESATARPPVLGTINILCTLSRPMSDMAMLEAVSMVAEARTTAVLAADLPSPTGAGAATGTGTDCCVVAAPFADAGDEELHFVGLHTAAGEAIGRAVLEAVGRGVAGWIEAVKRVGEPR